jgi:hypothetical protein
MGNFPVQRVSLSGTGSSTLERGDQKLSFRYADKDMLVLLNKLYRIRFFELPTRYTAKYSVFLKDDGSVGTQALKMSDASSTNVCFTVMAYEKYVTYSSEAPRELEDMVQRIFSEADRLVKLR